MTANSRPARPDRELHHPMPRLCKVCWTVLFATTLLGIAAKSWGQQALPEVDPEDEDVILDITADYDGNYRSGAWVPVDVRVRNNDLDISGWLEVRAYQGDRVESPIYRLPIESPKGSQKRFRLYAQLERADNLRATLYDGAQPALEVPARLNTRPIGENDQLAMVLDKFMGDYGFMNTVRLRTSGGNPQTAGHHRIYRKMITGGTLDLLPDHPASYQPYDLIIIGDVRVEEIQERHRRLIEQYVRNGGVLAVCTGANAPKLRNTWLEELTGVEIGPEEFTSEIELAKAMLGPDGTGGAREDFSVSYATLEPKSFEMNIIGHDIPLATMRPLGRGMVATFAVDAASRALQESEGYLIQWRNLLERNNRGNVFAYEAAASHFASSLPQFSDIQLYSKFSVMTYLFLYFGIAIVGNWLVCSWLRRREWAWFFLIVFSAGFTAYALVFGTAGRAKDSKLQALSVVRVPAGATVANVHTTAGLLSARTRTYQAELPRPWSLVSDAGEHRIPGAASRGFGVSIQRPFYFIEGTEPRVEALRVGASELRVVQISSIAPISGGIEGTLEYKSQGLTGRLTNRTGYDLDEAIILHNGALHRAHKAGPVWQPEPQPFLSLPITQSELRRPIFRVSGDNPARENYLRQGFFVNLLQDTQGLLGPGVGLLPERAAEPGGDARVPQGGGVTPSPGQPELRRIIVGTYLIGWDYGGMRDALEINPPVETGINDTLVIADIKVTGG